MKKISSIFFGIIKAILKFIYSIFKKELSEEEWNKWYQFIGFCLVGVSNFLVTFIVFNVCVYCFKMDPLLANVPAFFLSVLNAFFWNNKYVFKENDETGNRNIWLTLVKTYLTYAFSGLVLTTALTYLEHNILGIAPILIPVINLVITTPINFIISKLWTYKGKKEAV